MDKQTDFVLRTIEERGIKFIRLWFTDVIGTRTSSDRLLWPHVMKLGSSSPPQSRL